MKFGPRLWLTVFLLSLGSLSAQSSGLIPLRLKEMPRQDRIPKQEAKSSPLLESEPASELPRELPSEAWPGEQFAQSVQAQLDRLASASTSEELRSLLAKSFQASELETPLLKNEVNHYQGSLTQQKLTSPEAFVKKLTALGKIKIKVIDATGKSTHLHVEANRTNPKRAEYSATWLCSWEHAVGEPPRLSSLQVEHFGVVFSPKVWMQDATHTVLADNPRYIPQVLHGIEYWAQRITRIGDLAMTGHHGIAVGDVNGDGLEDLYVCDGGSLPNQLYLQQADGTAREVAAKWDVDWLEDSRGALLIDLDNDGDQDLVVATIAMIAFAENNGVGKFILRGGFPGAPYPFSLSAADFDRDGDLDLYTCVYSKSDQASFGKRGFEATSPVPFNDAENGGSNVLLANLGNFNFRDVTKQVGLDQNNTRWSFAAAWDDYDRDGDPDLYVANDFGRNCLYRNDKGHFTNVAKEAGVEDIGAGMSVSWGDSNRDGSSDILVGNMFSSAGRRVASQRSFTAPLTRMARGNSLFTTSQSGFQDSPETVGLTHSGWAWSSAFADLDNDGWQDVIVANGYLSNTRDNDL